MTKNQSKFWIFVPRFNGGAEILFRDIIIIEVRDSVPVSGYQYQIERGRLIRYAMANYEDYKELKDLNARRILVMDHIQDPKISNISGNFRSVWEFETEEEALIQKLMLLEFIRETFDKKQKEMKIEFDTRIPPDVTNILEDQRSKFPELVL